jgi:ComF family protein
MGLWQHFFHLVLPPCCIHCHTITSNYHSLCSICWNQVYFLSTPRCCCCGWPLPYEGIEANSLCGKCLSQPPLFSQALSIFAYRGTIRSLILKLKQQDTTSLIPCLAQFLLTHGRPLFENTDLLIPVPLHRWRLLKRGFNQASLLSNFVSQHTNIPTYSNILIRSKPTKPQSSLTKLQRQANLKNAFQIKNSKAQILKNKSVLLLDDIWTTGTTLQECCRTLLRAGAKEIKVLTLTRVVPFL